MSKKESAIMAYSMKAKENREMKNPVIEKSVKGARTTYIAKGMDKDGNKMAKIVSLTQAEELISAGTAKKGFK